VLATPRSFSLLVSEVSGILAALTSEALWFATLLGIVVLCYSMFLPSGKVTIIPLNFRLMETICPSFVKFQRRMLNTLQVSSIMLTFVILLLLLGCLIWHLSPIQTFEGHKMAGTFKIHWT